MQRNLFITSTFSYNVKIIAFYLFIFSTLKCTKNKDGYDIYKVPSSLFFLVKQNNNKLTDTLLNNCSLYYIKNGNKNYIEDFGRATEEGRDLGILTTRLIGIKSGYEGIKTYYLEYPIGLQDTLFVDYSYLTQDQAYYDPCKCLYPLRSVKFNGQEAKLDSTFINIQKVYSFNKK